MYKNHFMLSLLTEPPKMKVCARIFVTLFLIWTFSSTTSCFDVNRVKKSPQLDGFANVFERLMSRFVGYGQSALRGGLKSIGTTLGGFQNLAGTLFGFGPYENQMLYQNQLVQPNQLIYPNQLLQPNYNVYPVYEPYETIEVSETPQITTPS